MPLGGVDKAALNKMMDEVERVYSTFITRVVRNPNSEYQKESRPILVAAPDRPVLKNEKQELRDVKINGGVHMHGDFVSAWAIETEGRDRDPF